MLLFFCNARVSVFRWTFVDKLLFCIYRAQLVARKYFRSFLILRVFLRFYNRDGFIGGGERIEPGKQPPKYANDDKTPQ